MQTIVGDYGVYHYRVIQAIIVYSASVAWRNSNTSLSCCNFPDHLQYTYRPTWTGPSGATFREIPRTKKYLCFVPSYLQFGFNVYINTKQDNAMYCDIQNTGLQVSKVPKSGDWLYGLK